MIRFLVLAGYYILMMYLQTSGKLDQYINAHYRYLSVLSMILAALLAIVQLISWVRSDQNKNCHHEHNLSKKASFFSIIFLSIPLIVGLLFPTVSLNSTIIDAKGFNFPLSKEATGTSDTQIQYLKPDTSGYFNQDDYHQAMKKLKAKYGSKKTLEISATNFLETMELIYNYPAEFTGKKITYTGFAYLDPTNHKHEPQFFLFRFGIIHCIADSGVFGLLNRCPKNLTVKVKNNQWFQINGTIKTEFYQPMKRQIPIVKIDSLKQKPAPKKQYVYRTF